MQDADVVDALPEGALAGYALQCHVNYLGRVVFDERGAVQAGYEGSAVKAVTAVHDVTHAVCNVKRLGNHARGHKTDEIGLDLEVQVVGVRVVEPVAGLRRHDALADVVPAGLIGMGKMVGRVCKPHGQFFRRRVKPQLPKSFGEGEVVVNVVKEAGLAEPPVLDVAFSPGDGHIVRDQRSAELEFRGSTVNHAYCLAGPAAHYLVHERILREGYAFRSLGAGTGGAQSQEKY